MTTRRRRPVEANLEHTRRADEERAERARRVASMLERWAAEDVSDEPAWRVADVPRLSFPSRTK